MDNFARLSADERREAFQEAAAQKDVSFQIIEKDFWVCWTLRRLFNLEGHGPQFVFKGGTSLSKVYEVIQRFSEDIDVAIERSYLSATNDSDFIGLSNNQRERLVEELDEKCRDLVQGKILHALRESITSQIGTFGWVLNIDAGDQYGQTILFEYPRSLNDGQEIGVQYIRPIVKIELGARPTNEPSEVHRIQPYLAESFPNIFADPMVELKVLAAERTFWEKATILHELHNRQPGYVGPERFSRHYYDLYQMSTHGYANKALERIDILRSVVANKKAYFFRGGARYDEVLTGQFHLLPTESGREGVRRDYEQMGIMIFGDAPRFGEILEELERLESAINTEIRSSEKESKS